MNAWLTSPWLLPGVVGAFAFAAIIVVILVARPGVAKLPMDRRRPGVAAGPSALGVLSEKTTAGIDKLLKGRGAGIAGRLERAGLKYQAKDFVLVVGSGTLAVFALGLLLGGPGTGLFLSLVGPVGAWFVLEFLAGRRRAAFSDQLDETLSTLAGSLRAGYSLGQAISTVATEADAPTSEEFARVVNEMRVGRSMGEALEEVAGRARNEDFFWITQAIAINREVGGNLADVLDGVGHTIRERASLRRQVAALSAEGKFSAIVMGALPFAMVLMLQVVNPGYMDKLFSTLPGMVMMGAGLAALGTGIIWLAKVTKIKY